MSLSSLMDTTVTLVRRSNTGSADVYGNPTDTETLVQTTGSLQQRRRSEDASAGEVSETLWDLFLPTGTALDTGDGVVVGNSRYEVVGQPWDAAEGSVAVHHVEATLRRVAGQEDAS